MRKILLAITVLFVTSCASQMHSDVITVPALVHFDLNSSKLNSSNMDTIKQQAWFLNNAGKDMYVTLQGNTDDSGSLQYNKKLSLERATAVKDSLVSHGVDAKRIYIVGFSYTNPDDVNKTAADRAFNRRVVTYVSNKKGAMTEPLAHVSYFTYDMKTKQIAWNDGK